MKYFLLTIFFFGIGVPSAWGFGVDLHVPEKYGTVKAGDRLYFEISIEYPENTARKDLRFEYQVREGDTIITSSRLLKAVENQASFIDYMIIPSRAHTGTHEIVLNVTDYDTLEGQASATFEVKKTSDQGTIYFYVLLGAVVIFAITILYQINRLRGRVPHA